MKLVSITNPELRRNLWLELTLHRLLAAPLVIALCAALILAASEKDSLEILTGAAGTGFVATVLLWGTQLAGASVMDEARDRTWDYATFDAAVDTAAARLLGLAGDLSNRPASVTFGGAELRPLADLIDEAARVAGATSTSRVPSTARPTTRSPGWPGRTAGSAWS